jgi:hypothetical protein
MKGLIFSSMALVGLLLVGLQHQRIRELRAENVTLQQASAEADQLKADLAKSTGNEAQDAEEIDRLREENRDLLKLRNEANQLREARVQFEKVSAENQRLQSLAKSAVRTETKQSTQPVVIRIDNLFNRGLGTPEDAVQTFYWAQRERNSDILFRSVTPGSRNNFRDYVDGWRRQNFDNYVSIEIVGRRDVNATTVQLGVQIHEANNPQYGQKIVVTLVLQANEWRVDTTSR